MAKIYARCKLCDAKKLVNGIGLCKRCGKSPLSAKISNKAFAKHEAELAEAAANPEPVEETTEETTESSDGKSQEESKDDSKEKAAESEKKK